MTQVGELYSRMIYSLGVETVKISLTAVKIFEDDAAIPQDLFESFPEDITLTCCQACRQASLGDEVLLTVDNIGCVAAAISLGLVDELQDTPLEGSRTYTELMRTQSELEERFRPPTPKDFTSGVVYACQDSGRREFCLFGNADSGRFKDIQTAQRAIADMAAIQPPRVQGVFFYSHDYDDPALYPDIIILSLRPVELARIVQAYQYQSGNRARISMGAVRAVCSDLIANPFLYGTLNISTYCLGARLIAQYGPEHMAIGMPFSTFDIIVNALEDSQSGYPFHLYPGVEY